MNNEKVVTMKDLGRERAEYSILVNVIERVGLSLSPDDKVFKDIIDLAMENNITAKNLYWVALMVGLVYDDQIDVSTTQSDKFSADLNSAVNFMKAINLLDTNLTESVINHFGSEPKTKIIKNTNSMLSVSEVYTLHSIGEFTIVSDQNIPYEMIKEIMMFTGLQYVSFNEVIRDYAVRETIQSHINGEI